MALDHPIMLPLVSVCTPTFNRRPFVPFMVQCFLHQTYPLDRMEWIIVDDGTDPIEDLVAHLPQVKYIRLTDKLPLGKKRNLMHSFCLGDILVYMDDDDYYPPSRVQHAVTSLTNAPPNVLLAGCSELHIYFASRQAVFQCGPYRTNHATAASFAFKKELLQLTAFDDASTFAEEVSFTQHYSIPLLQLDPQQTILVFSHRHNSLNKERLLERPDQTLTQPSRFTVDDFCKEPALKQFYMHDMNTALLNYVPGEPSHADKYTILEHVHAAERNRHRIELDRLRTSYEQQLADKNALIDRLLLRIKQLSSSSSSSSSSLSSSASSSLNKKT